jgi:hypothetical protein
MAVFMMEHHVIWLNSYKQKMEAAGLKTFIS